MPSPTTGSPTSDVAFTHDPAIDGLLIGTKWGGALGTGVVVSFSFPDTSSTWSTIQGGDPNGYDASDPANDNPFASQYHGLNATQQDAVRASLGEWSHVADIGFVEVADNASEVGDIRVAFTNGGDIGHDYAYAFTPAPFAYAGDVWLNSAQPVPSGNDFSLGANGYGTVIHELGHAIGLDHPFSLRAFPHEFDSFKYSVMSYSDFAGHQDSGDSSYYPTTPMLFDIRALQYLYGANMSWHAGDDTYVFSEGARYYETIWDAGGNDTFQYVSAGDGARIDLRAGNFSQLGLPITLSDGTIQQDDVAIAFNVVIENAIGGDGNDILIGNSAANTLSGGAGDDMLDGQGGADSLVGGPGNDSYVIDGSDTVHEDPGGGIDTVTAGFSYSLAPDIENLVLAGSGSINGTGNAADNRITGNSGANLLDGGAGNDSMTGGAGNDTYIVDSAGDSVIEASPSGGTDRVLSSVSFALGANLENLTLTGSAAIDGTGNARANILTGNSGDNALDGQGGDDTMIGGAGNDTMAGGAGNDRYVVDSAGDSVSELAGGGIDRVESSVSWVLGQNVENLLLLPGAGDIDATGNAGNNVLTGNDGNNVFDGGAGNDTMSGGAGNDSYFVADAGDVVIEAANGGTDTIYAIRSFTLSANIEDLTLLPEAGAASATGNGGNNVLTGNAFDNVLSGGAGNDVLFGGRGYDLMTGGTGDDTYYVNRGDGAGTARLAPLEDQVVELLNGGSDTVVSGMYTYTLDANVENLVLEGVARKGFGNALDNAMTGDDLNNSLDGGAGNDVLEGGAGTDRLTGGAGNDTFVFDGLDGSVDRILDYSAADDTIELSLAGFAGIGAVGAFDANAFVANAGGVAGAADDHILYNTTTGALYYDADGDGGAAAVQFASLAGAPALTAADFAVVA